MTITTLGALIGLTTAILLIFKKVNPAYAMILGAIVGGLVGGVGITDTINIVINGAESIVPAVLRVLTAGIFAGVLIETKAADKIADTIISTLGERKAVMAIILATCVICAVGVVIPVSIITVAPVALLIGEKAGISKASVLLAMLGGGKAGNIMSPNPNAIAISESFHVDVSLMMINGIIPALFGIIITYFVAQKLVDKGEKIGSHEISNEDVQLPEFKRAIVGPISVIAMLAISTVFKLHLDPLIILPVGGLITAIVLGEVKNFKYYMTCGLNRMTGAAILLLSTGTIAGVVSNSSLSSDIISLINGFGISGVLLASISGILMGGATASITGGAVVTSKVFSGPILDMGVGPISAAEMVHTGVSVIDDLPHGNLFHISAQSVSVNIKQRSKLIPYEILIGLTMNIIATALYGYVF